MDPISTSADSRAVALARRVLRIEAAAVAALAAYAAAEQDDRVAGRRSADRLRDPSEPLPEIGPDSYIRQDYAARGMKVNLGVGWLVGAATGLGLGALIVGGVKDLFRRR